jgi:uncharacterized lipoprotein YbaY
MTMLHGRVEFAAVPHAVRGGTLWVRLVDVGRADAPATTVAEKAIPGVTILSAADRVDFVLDVPDLDARKRYAVEAHLDVDGSGVTSVGDYRTMEHFGVRPETIDQPVTVQVRPVT